MAGEEQEKPEDDKDLELDLMAEQELLRLTRQFRVRKAVDGGQGYGSTIQ